MRNAKKTEDYNILFCFATDCRGIANELMLAAKEEKINLNIEYDSKLGDLFEYEERLSSFCCVLLQEYLDVMNPLTIDFFINLSQILNVRLACIFSESKRNKYQKRLFENGLYDCFFGEDASRISDKKLIKILTQGRSKKEAAMYYKIEENTGKSMTVEELFEIISKCKNGYYDDEKIASIVDKMPEEDYAKIVLMAKEKDLPYLFRSSSFHSFYNNFESKFSNKKNKFNFFPFKGLRNSKVQYISKKNIAVVSASKGAGSTFISTSIAHILSKKLNVSYIEFPTNDPYMFHYFGYDMYDNECMEAPNVYKNIRENLSDDFEALKIRAMPNISWLINTPSYIVDDWDVSNMFKLLYYSKNTDVVILDVGYNMLHKSFFDIFDQFYMIIVVVDAMIPNLLLNPYYLNMLRQQAKKYDNVKFLLNKYNCAVVEKQINECLGRKVSVYADAVDCKYLCDAVYNYKLPTCHKQVYSNMERSLKTIIKDIIN